MGVALASLRAAVPPLAPLLDATLKLFLSLLPPLTLLLGKRVECLPEAVQKTLGAVAAQSLQNALSRMLPLVRLRPGCRLRLQAACQALLLGEISLRLRAPRH